MPYIGVSPQFGVRRKHTYTATAGQTSFSGAGSEGATLSYTDSNFVDVYQNGVKLGDADYTSTSGTAIVLAQGASVDDLVEIIVFDAFSAADTVSKADGGTFDGAVTFGAGVSGNIANVSGDMTIDVAEDIILDADGGDVTIKDGGTDIGAISNISSDLSIYSLTGNHKGLRFGNAQIVPTNNAGADSDNTTDLGGTSNRFKSLYLSDGVYVSGTADGNKLDNYDEGSWIPALSDGSSTLTIATPTAYYTRIGNYVHAEFYIQRTDSASNSATMILQGLPFAHKAIPAIVGQCWIDNASSTDIRCFLYLPSSYSQLYFVEAGSDSGYVTLNEFENNRYIYGAFDYHV